MSGLNRHTRQEDVLFDPKNRLVASYMGMIEHHAPPYLLIEQVGRPKPCCIVAWPWMLGCDQHLCMVLVHMPNDAAMGACIQLQRRQHVACA